MWKKVVEEDWIPPDYVEEEVHSDVRVHPEKYDDYFVAFVRFGASFGADWNGGFARNVRKDRPNADVLNRTSKSYSKQSKNNILKQVPFLKGVLFSSVDYKELDIPDNSIIYCDPPYEGTTKYKDSFNHADFWEWCKEKHFEGHKLFVSEYHAPDNWKPVWESPIRNGLNNRDIKFNKIATEKLFVCETQ